MTPTILQDSLVKDFKEQFKGFLLKNAEGKQVPLNIYAQNLPAKKKSKDSLHFPYLLIRVINGETQEESGLNNDTCEIDFITGIYSDEDNFQGYKDVMNVLEKIKYRLFTKKFYVSRFELIMPYKWTIHDEDTYPYFFGGAETHWKMPILNMDDNLI